MSNTIQNATFHFVRDYETVKIEQDIIHEFLLTFTDGVEADSSSSSNENKRGALYKNIERKINLKKKRVNVSI